MMRSKLEISSKVSSPPLFRLFQQETSSNVMNNIKTNDVNDVGRLLQDSPCNGLSSGLSFT